MPRLTDRPRPVPWPTSFVVKKGSKIRLARNVRLNLEIFNVFNRADADVDYFYVSRLPGELLEGVADLHTHPTIPRTARLSIHVGF